MPGIAATGWQRDDRHAFAVAGPVPRPCLGAGKVETTRVSAVFAGQNVGVKEISEKIWLVSFMQYDLGFFDHESVRVECAPNPFEAKVLLGFNGSSKHLPQGH